jgi:hypothetical protein
MRISVQGRLWKHDAANIRLHPALGGLAFTVQAIVNKDTITNPTIRNQFSKMKAGDTGYLKMDGWVSYDSGFALDIRVSRITQKTVGDDMAMFQFVGTSEGNFILDLTIMAWSEAAKMERIQIEPQWFVKLDLSHMRVSRGYLFGKFERAQKLGFRTTTFRLDREADPIADERAILDQIFDRLIVQPSGPPSDELDRFMALLTAPDKEQEVEFKEPTPEAYEVPVTVQSRSEDTVVTPMPRPEEPMFGDDEVTRPRILVEELNRSDAEIQLDDDDVDVIESDESANEENLPMRRLPLRRRAYLEEHVA